MNRNCPAGEPGHVTCDGVTTSCPACACTEGQVRYSYVGICCCDYPDDTHPVKRQRRNRQTCINGEWRDTGTVCNAQRFVLPMSPYIHLATLQGQRRRRERAVTAVKG